MVAVRLSGIGLLLCLAALPTAGVAQVGPTQAALTQAALTQAGSAQGCPADTAPPLALSQTQAALDTGREIVIVTIGSSSTAGWHATDIAHGYPAVLQATLSASLPQTHVAVLNRGVGGQDAPEMVQRLERDVIDAHPSLVIWQVGANAAVRRANPDDFQRLVMAGVQRLQRAKIDVVLMDNQRAPAILASAEHARIDEVLQTVATQTGAGLFSRGALMERWQRSGHPYAEFVSSDGLHHNDHGYRCLGQAVAKSVLDGITVRSFAGSILRLVRSAALLGRQSIGQ